MRSWWRGALCGAALLALGLAAPAARASDAVSFWFASPADPDGAPISSLAIDGAGTSFTVSLWYQSVVALPHNLVNVFVGFDQTDTVGTAASPLDGLIGLGASPEASLSEIGPDFQLLAPALGGGQRADPGPRPYGIDIPLEGPLGQFLTAEAPTKLADLTLKNQGLNDGTYTLTLWDGGVGDEFTSFLIGDEIARPEVVVALLLTAQSAVIPEPGTLALFGLGGAALLALRRRRLAYPFSPQRTEAGGMPGTRMHPQCSQTWRTSPCRASKASVELTRVWQAPQTSSAPSAAAPTPARRGRIAS